MTTETLVAVCRLRHNGEWLKAGDEVKNMDVQDAKDLIALGMIQRLTLGGLAQDLASAIDSAQSKPRRTQYSRRDLKAEEE